MEHLQCQNKKKGKRKVQGVPQSQTAALPRHQEEEEIDKIKQAQIEQTKTSSLFSKRGNCNAKKTEKKTQEQNNTRQDIKQIASWNKPQSNKEKY